MFRSLPIFLLPRVLRREVGGRNVSSQELARKYFRRDLYAAPSRSLNFRARNLLLRGAFGGRCGRKVLILGFWRRRTGWSIRFGDCRFEFGGSGCGLCRLRDRVLGFESLLILSRRALRFRMV